IVPARQKAGEGAPVLVGEMAEGAGHRLLDDHLTQLAHDQKGNETANRIAQQHRRPGAFHHPGGTKKQTGADGATQGDQLNMAIGQAALELALLLRWFGHEESVTGELAVKGGKLYTD